MDGFLVSDQDIIRMMKTVDEAFNDISDAWAANAEEVTVTYDNVAGYPTQVYIDQTSEIADEELRFTIQNVLLLWATSATHQSAAGYSMFLSESNKQQATLIVQSMHA